jgi:hypothetical protein
MNINKIVFLDYIPLTRRRYQTCYFSELQENGFVVEFLDFINIFHPGLDGIENYDEFGNIIHIDQYSQFELYLKGQDVKNILFIPIHGLNGKTIKLYRILTRYKCTIGFFSRGNLPIVLTDLNTLKNKIKRTHFKYIFSFLKTRRAYLFRRLGLISFCKYIFIAGNSSAAGINLLVNADKTKVIKINSIDYDAYLENKNSPSLIDGEYCLFLDEYAAYHRDIIINSGGKFINAEDYFQNLNNYFTRIEKTLNIPVVIAAHPRALKYKDQNFFNGRKVIFDKTAQLCAHASLIMNHCSTSALYAVMFRKKLLFLMSKEYEHIYSYLYSLTKNYAKETDSPIIYFDNDDAIILPTNVINEQKRNDLLYKYMTSKETENMKSVDVFLDFVKKLSYKNEN